MKKYGYIFLIKAAGLNSQEVLNALKDRLVNDPETEKVLSIRNWRKSLY